MTKVVFPVKVLTAAGLALSVLAAAAGPLAADEAPDLADLDLVTVGAGAFDVTDNGELTSEGFIDYRFAGRVAGERFGPRYRGIGHMVGLKANTDGGVMGHGSLFLDLRPADDLMLWPSAGIGGYRQGSSRDLGGVFQFHLGVLLAYRVGARSLLGLSLQHVSNANLQRINPGADSVFVTYTLGFSPPLR